MSRPNNLQQLVSSKKLTTAGADWLRTALDPFHDYARDFEGYPDIVSAKSKVQMATTTISIASPDGNPYSARVWTNPCYGSNATQHFEKITATDDEWIDIDVVSNYGSNLLVVADAWNGASNPDTSAPGATFARGAAGYAQYNGPNRIVAMGLEIHNTTPPLYQSGIVTCSRQNNFVRTESRIVDDSTSATPAVPTVQLVQVNKMPPTTASDALVVPGATQWHASKGAYLVAHLAKSELPVEWNTSIIQQYDSGLTCATLESTVAHGSMVRPYYDTLRHSFDLPYALLTGLSAESTFQVTVRVFFEYFPVEASILRYATPSPPFDPKALELYGLVAASLPLAVPVDMNAKGDYFRMVMQAISGALAALAPVTAAIHPSAPVVAQIASEVAKVLAKKPRRTKPALPPKKKAGFGSVRGQPTQK
jgi:hypothetical protein